MDHVHTTRTMWYLLEKERGALFLAQRKLGNHPAVSISSKRQFCRQSQAQRGRVKTYSCGTLFNFMTVPGVVKGGATFHAERHPPPPYAYPPDHLMLAVPSKWLTDRHIIG